METLRSVWVVACSAAVLWHFAVAAKDPCFDYPECSKLDNFNLPDCKSDAKPSAVRKCAETNLEKGKSCRMFVQRSFQSYAAGVRLAEKTLCDTAGLKEAFENQNKCWRGAVGCVASFLGAAAGQEQTPDQCKLSVNSAKQCSDQKSSDCLPLQHRFLDHAVARTPCHLYLSSGSRRHTPAQLTLMVATATAIAASRHGIL